MVENDNDTFSVQIPAEIIKANGKWTVQGLASTSNIDIQGETILPEGVDLTPIDENKGILNWDHLPGPENTIGVLTGYSKTPNGIFIKGDLFQKHDKAKAVKQIMESLAVEDRGRMGLSVEGSIISRDPRNPKIITKCRINAVALTMKPVNSDTYASMVKSLAGAELDFQSEADLGDLPDQILYKAEEVLALLTKALGVGAGYTQAPNELSGGDALATSNLKPEEEEAEEEDKKPKAKKANLMAKSASLFKADLRHILNQMQILYPKHAEDTLWAVVRSRIEDTYNIF